MRKVLQYRVSLGQSGYIKKYFSTLTVGRYVNAQFQKNLNYFKSCLYGPSVDEVLRDVDLSGKTCLLTGATGGIGAPLAAALSARGCALLLPSRNTYVAHSLRNKHLAPENTRIYECNLTSLESVDNCCDKIEKDVERVDMVVLGAGVRGQPWSLTRDGLETTFQVNFLSQLRLLQRAEPLLAPDARVVFLTSEAHRSVDWDPYESMVPHVGLLSAPRARYSAARAYAVSQLCALLAARVLGDRWARTARAALCANPGELVRTNLYGNERRLQLLCTLMAPFTKNTMEAAATPALCAASPALRGRSALYVRGARAREPAALAQDPRLAYRVLAISEDELRRRCAPRAPRAPRAAPREGVAGAQAGDGDADEFEVKAAVAM